MNIAERIARKETWYYVRVFLVVTIMVAGLIAALISLSTVILH